MQTFLPYADYQASARCLDRARLGKQRVEVLQILRALRNGGGWSNHPAVRMWRGHERSLAAYGCAMCDEWMARGYRDSCRNKILDEVSGLPVKSGYMPPWMGNRKVHASHRSNLLRKDPQHYARYGWIERDDLPYEWPGEGQ